MQIYIFSYKKKQISDLLFSNPLIFPLCTKKDTNIQDQKLYFIINLIDTLNEA